ncbi:MAG: hypothetical protein NZ570_07075 [Candidatus Caldarchaeum sp.]|nr:hypothetical protein [Candidatus Caldarchaeum sp.]
MRRLEAVYAAALITLLAFQSVGGQMQDPCITADSKINLLETTPPLTGTLSGRLHERFYRLENLKPGEMVKIDVAITTNTSAAINMLMLWEIRPNQFTHIITEQSILVGGPYSFNFTWTHGNLGDNRPTSICFKIGLFSEAVPAKAEYTATVAVQRLHDVGGGDAANRADKAVQIGSVGSQPVSVSGHLSSVKQGSDHIDFYVFTAALGKGKELVVELTTAGENNYEIALLDHTLFSLRYNLTGDRGKATVYLTNEEPGEKTYYLKVSNNAGVGGGGPYTISLSTRDVAVATATGTATNRQTATQTIEQPTISHETARAIVYGSVVSIAAVAVAATVLMRRRSQATVVEEEWWGQ